MSRERRRAALAALCVLAVALAATLLPASGFGSQPAGVGVGGDAADAPGGDGTDAPRQPTEATAPPDTTSQDAKTTASDGGDETTTSTTTTTTTTTTGTAPSGSTPIFGTDLFVTAATGLFGLVGLLALIGFATGILEVSSQAAGALPFTLTIGGTPLGALVGRIPNRTMATIVALSSSIPRLLDDAASLAGAVGRSLGSVLGAAGRGTAEAFRIGAKGLALTVTSIPRALAGLSAGVGVFSGLGNVSMPSLGRGGSDDGDDRNRSTSSGEQADPVPPTVEEAWETMRDRVPVRNRRARTPGEVARAAARRGFPDEAVRRLTDSFREVRYGDLPRDERTDSAHSALDRLRDYWRGDEK